MTVKHIRRQIALTAAALAIALAIAPPAMAAHWGTAISIRNTQNDPTDWALYRETASGVALFIVVHHGVATYYTPDGVTLYPTLGQCEAFFKTPAFTEWLQKATQANPMSAVITFECPLSAVGPTGELE